MIPMTMLMPRKAIICSFMIDIHFFFVALSGEPVDDKDLTDEQFG